MNDRGAPQIEENPQISDRNLRGELQGFTTEEIRALLDQKRRKFGVLAVNVQNDLNLGNMLRCHNAFLGSNFYYLGQKRFYTPGTVGTHHYEPLEYVENVENARKVIPEAYNWVAIDNIQGAEPLHTFEWPENPLLVFGSEHFGLDKTPELLYHCRYRVEIPQFGSVRSLNVASACAIIMYDLALQQGWLETVKSR